MEANNKDLMKRELIMIRNLHQKTNYMQLDRLKAFYDYAISENIFQTDIGKKYLNRLLRLSQSNSDDTSCIICGKECEDNPMVCNNCDNKLLHNKKEDTKESSSELNELNNTNYNNVSSNQQDDFNSLDSKVKKPYKKRLIVSISSVLFVLLFIFYMIGKSNPIEDDSTTLSSIKDITKNEQSDLSNDLTANSEMDNNNPNLTDEITATDNESKSNDKEETEPIEAYDYFLITENELMSQIQTTLLKQKLDIGTNKDYPHIFFVMNSVSGNVSNVTYQTKLNENGNLQTISVNLTGPSDELTLDIFSKAVTAAIIACDSTIKLEEITSLIDAVLSTETITIHNINYFAYAPTANILSYVITKADIPDIAIDDTETNNINNQTVYDLSDLLGMTRNDIHKKIGDPLSTDANSENYSDLITIVYEEDLAYKIILGLDERFDFTKKQIPNSTYHIQNIHLGDTEASVLDITSDTRVFLIDGVFYGNTYQTKLDQHVVNVDFFTLQMTEGNPVYRIVITRLYPVD